MKKIVLFCVALHTMFLCAQDGTLDSTFGTGGIVTQQVGLPAITSSTMSDVTMQPDQKILVTGPVNYDFIGFAPVFYTARYLEPGVFDTTFNPGGTVSGSIQTQFPGTLGGLSRNVFSYPIAGEDTIIVTGWTLEDPTGRNNISLLRYHPDATLDASFGVGGFTTTVSTIPGASIQVTCGDLVNNKILLGAYISDFATFTDFLLARYNAQDGSLDTTFNPLGAQPGIVVTDIAGGATQEQLYGVAVQSDDRIVGVGASGLDMIVIRYTSVGVLDATFNGSGYVIQPIPGAIAAQASGVAMQLDGKIVVSGFYDTGVSTAVVVLRYLTDGTLDTSFATGGIFTLDISGGNDQLWEVTLQPNGKIIAVGGTSLNGSNVDFLLMRLTSDGFLDTTFGNGGIVVTETLPGMDFDVAVTLQADGKILGAGGSTDISVESPYVIARYLNGCPLSQNASQLTLALQAKYNN